MRFIPRLFGPYNGVKTPSILQLAATECGVASLAMIFSYYKVNAPIEVLREKCGSSRDGAKANTLIKIAEDYGFHAAGYKVELEDIQALTKPVIAFWRFNHYIVVNGVRENKVFINDPAYGAMTVTLDEFDKSFTGIILDISPTAETVPIKKKSVFRPMVNEWLARYKAELSFVLICMLVVIGGPLLNSAFSRFFIDYCVIGKNTHWIPAIVIVSVISSLIFTYSLLTQKLSQFRLTAKASIIKSSQIMLHMLQLPLLFYSLRQKPEIVAVLMRAEVIANILFQSLSSILISVLASCFCLYFLLKLDPVLLGCLIVCSLVFLLFFAVLSRINYAYEQGSVNALGKFYGTTLSSIKNCETIKTCGLEAKTVTRWMSVLMGKIQAQDKSNTLNLVMTVMQQSLGSISMLLTLCIGGYRIADGLLSVGNLMAFYALQLYFSAQLLTVFRSLKEMQNANVSYARIHDMLEYKIDDRFRTDNQTQNESAVRITPLLQCRDISFHFNKSAHPTLSNIDLEIHKGQHIALVGGTGSGKSTLVKVLSHLYSASTGSIIINDHPISYYSSEALPRLFAYVAQDVTLFAGTFYENLTLWRDDISQDIINAAIHDACLDALVATRGLHAKVEENGGNFSGGERQRIDIARALIQSASILILDEATSSLDVQTEALLIERLRRRNLTIVFVAHRLSTIQHCNQILVLENGQIVERGTHEQLIAQSSHYYRLLQEERKLQ
jgi:ABC-type bacteriocin/lantibiotic exporter with double-glycine peptidase domain